MMLDSFCVLIMGRGHFSRFINGSLAPTHLLDGLSEEWILERDQSGKVRSVKDILIAGFKAASSF